MFEERKWLLGGGSPFEHEATRLKALEYARFITLGLIPGEEDCDISALGGYTLENCRSGVLHPRLRGAGGSNPVNFGRREVASKVHREPSFQARILKVQGFHG